MPDIFRAHVCWLPDPIHYSTGDIWQCPGCLCYYRRPWWSAGWWQMSQRAVRRILTPEERLNYPPPPPAPAPGQGAR